MMTASKTARSALLKRWLRGSAVAVTLAAAGMLMFGTTTLKADCGIPAKHLMGSVFKPSAFITMAPEEHRDSDRDHASFVGLWHVKLLIGGDPNNLLFQSLVQYHPDGLEAESADQSSITPANYCMGVWKNVAPNTVEIYHVAWLFDNGTPVGYAVIKQRNTLSSDKNSYSGNFEFIQYQYDTDTNGNITGAEQVADFGGTTVGHRVDFHHPFSLY